jgi:hypothetical protein
MEHYTALTVSVSAFCAKCGKHTQHRVDGHRKGPCLACIERLNAAHASAPPKAEVARQQNLFVMGVDL